MGEKSPTSLSSLGVKRLGAIQATDFDFSHRLWLGRPSVSLHLLYACLLFPSRTAHASLRRLALTTDATKGNKSSRGEKVGLRGVALSAIAAMPLVMPRAIARATSLWRWDISRVVRGADVVRLWAVGFLSSSVVLLPLPLRFTSLRVGMLHLPAFYFSIPLLVVRCLAEFGDSRCSSVRWSFLLGGLLSPYSCPLCGYWNCLRPIWFSGVG